MKRAAYFLAAPLLCLIVFWRVPLTWFANDDFAWLGLPLEVHGPGSLLYILFTPKAQGTVRVFSERLFFLTFSSLFGLHAMPYHLFVLATWIGDLTLAALIGARLTGSRAAGMLAAVFWTTCGVIVMPLEWASAYNEVLCAFCVLLAFYARLRWIDSGRRRWRITEWIAYLAGFGVLEIIVVYPVVAALHALVTDRKRLRSTYLMFVPAVAFGIAHLLLIPKNAGPYYSLSIDARLPRTFLQYLVWTLGATRGRRNAMIAATVGVGLLIFVIGQLRRREFLPMFFCAWFVLFLGPVLPLPNHIEDYYATLPALGCSWLAGWAMVEAWRRTKILGILAVGLAAMYLVSSVHLIRDYTQWAYARSLRMRAVVLGVEQVVRAHPDAGIIMEGVDNDLFQAGFQDNPWRLFGLQKLYLVPGGEQGIVARADLGGVTPFLITPSQALNGIEHHQAYVLAVSSGSEPTRDITRSYEVVLRADPRASRRDFVDVGDLNDATFLGPEWYRAENGFRWMPKLATVKLSGPLSPSQKLYVTGYTPAPVVANGPVTLNFRIDGVALGSETLSQANQQFSFSFPLPAALTGRPMMEIAIEADKVLHPAGDNRDLAIVFGTFAIR